MEFFISSAIIFLLVAFLVIEIKFRQYIKLAYPKFWKSTSEDKMGVAAILSRPVAINDAVYFGELSKEKDSKIVNYKLFQKVALTSLLIITIIGILY